MRLMSYISKDTRTGVYYVRMMVPARLQAIVGKPALREFLGTTDKTEANRLAMPVVDKFKGILAAAEEAAKCQGNGTTIPLAAALPRLDAWKREEAACHDAWVTDIVATKPELAGVITTIKAIGLRNEILQPVDGQPTVDQAMDRLGLPRDHAVRGLVARQLLETWRGGPGARATRPRAHTTPR
jgi:hypothetical protein